MKALHMVTFILVILGAVNWGLVGIANFNLVDVILGGIGLTKIAYILVGLSGVYLIATHKGDCKTCGTK